MKNQLLFLFYFLVIPYYSWGFSCNFDVVNFTDNYKDLIKACCNHKEAAFGSFYPQDNRCNCQDLEKKINDIGGTGEDRAKQESHIVGTFNQCLKRAKEQQQEYCTLHCGNYIQYIFQGCPGQDLNKEEKSADQCSAICQSAVHFSGNVIAASIKDNATLPTEALTDITYEPRMKAAITKCKSESEETFLDNYEKKCEEKIKVHEQRNGGRRTLLCKKDATTENTGCKDYCSAKAKEHYGETPTSSSILDGYIAHLGGNDEGAQNKMSYRAMTSSESSELGNLIDEDSEDLERSFPEKNESKTVDDEFHLSWEKCKKGASMSCESELEAALHEAVQSCAELQSAAQECCHNPESCVGGGLAHALDGLGKLNVGLSALKGPQAQCDAVQQTYGLYSGMQGAMAAQCTNKANECVSQCQQKVEKVSKAFHAACDEYPTSGASWNESQHSCDKDFFEDYKKAYTSSNNQKQVSISSVPDKCKTTGKEANRRINDMTTNAGTSLLASMKECGWDGENWKSSFTGGPTDMDILPGEKEGNTTTGGSSSTGGGIQIPELPNPTATVGGGGSEEEERQNSLLGDLKTPKAVSPFDMEPGLGEEPEEGPPAPAGKMGGLLGGSGGGGGGGLGGLGGGGSAGGRGKAGGSGAKKGKKVLLGYRGGKFKGYGGGAGGSVSGGSRGRARGVSKKGRRLSSVDLKKILPKGKQLNNKIGKYGSPHDDIFKRLSDRIQWMCRTRRINCK